MRLKQNKSPTLGAHNYLEVKKQQVRNWYKSALKWTDWKTCFKAQSVQVWVFFSNSDVFKFTAWKVLELE